MYFTVTGGTEPGLWRTDGSQAGTERVLAQAQAPFRVSEGLAGIHYILAAAGGQAGLWSVAPGRGQRATLMVPLTPAQIYYDYSNQLQLAPLLLHEGRFYLYGSLRGRGATFLVSDGTPAGTQELTANHPQGQPWEPTGMVVAGGKLYFSSSADPAAGAELWSVPLPPSLTRQNWLNAHFGPAAAPTPALLDGDADADGVSNQAEYLAGTDPLSAASKIALEVIPGAGQLRISPAREGVSYTIFSSPDLINWTEEVTIAPPSSSASATAPIPVSQARLYFRARLEQQP